MEKKALTEATFVSEGHVWMEWDRQIAEKKKIWIVI